MLVYLLIGESFIIWVHMSNMSKMNKIWQTVVTVSFKMKVTNIMKGFKDYL